MLFIYFPLILFSILGYGFFVSNKIIKFNKSNLGYQGLDRNIFIIIDFLLSIQFVAT